MLNVKVLKLFVGSAFDPDSAKAIATVSAPKIVVCSQYADLRDENDQLIATLTWTSPVQVKEI